MFFRRKKGLIPELKASIDGACKRINEVSNSNLLIEIYVRLERLDKRLEVLEKKQHISGDKVKRLSRKVNKRKKK